MLPIQPGDATAEATEAGTLHSQLFAGDPLLEAIAGGAEARLSQSQNRNDPAVAKVQTALLDWDPDALPQFGADGDFGPETAAAVHRFKLTELAVPLFRLVDDVGQLTVRLLDEIRLAAEQATAASPVSFVRQDVYTLQPDGAPIHPIIWAYAVAVAQLKRNDEPNPHRRWSYHIQVHGMDRDPEDGLRNQCQHFSWYFLPWHRMEVSFFEAICRQIIIESDEVDDETKATWALPYWDYDRDGTRSLPSAFRDPVLGDGRPNPLFEAARADGINSPVLHRGETQPRLSRLRPDQVSADRWFTARPFSSRFRDAPGFGGTETGFHHLDEPPPSSGGPLETSPHGSVHNFVRGKMFRFESAADDPIFWLHHANVDRLWEVWRTGVNALDPTSPSFLDRRFTFLDANGSVQMPRCGDVLDIQALGYTYADISVPPSVRPGRRLRRMTSNLEQPPHRIGAIDNALTLSGDGAVAFDVAVEDLSVFLEGGGSLPQVLISIEHLEADGIPASMWGLYTEDLSGGSQLVGILPLFGFAEARRPDAEHDLSYSFDVSDLVADLIDQGLTATDRLGFSFRPVNDIVEDELDVPLTIGTFAISIA